MAPPRCLGVSDVGDYCNAVWSGTGKNRICMLWAGRFATIWCLNTKGADWPWMDAACREFPLAQPYLRGTYLDDSDGEDFECLDRLLQQGIV